MGALHCKDECDFLLMRYYEWYSDECGDNKFGKYVRWQVCATKSFFEYIYICCLMGMFNGKGIILIYSMDSVGIFHGES